MANDIIFYSNPWSRGRIVHWLLEEVGEPYTTHWLQYGEDMKSKQYLAINPMGKVPCVIHNGNVITEAAAICAYMAHTFPQKNLMPKASDLEDLGRYYRWLLFAAAPLEMAITTKAMQWPAGEEHARMLGFGTYKDTLDAIAGHLKGREFICDYGFSAADVYLGSGLIFGMEIKAVEQRPEFETYAQGLMQRPAYKRHVELCATQIKKSS